MDFAELSPVNNPLCGVRATNFSETSEEEKSDDMENEYVTLNIEGRVVKTKLTTLTSVKNSYFNEIFRGQWTKRLDQNGHLFIDRNSETFMVLIGYLRDGLQYPLPEDPYALRLIEYEARLFRLPELAAAAERLRTGLQSEAPFQAKTGLRPAPQRYSSQQSLPILSLPLPPPLPPSDSKTTLPRGAKTSEVTVKKVPKKEKKNLIGKPSNFAHVVHIGWNSEGKRVVVNKGQSEEESIKAIIAATEAESAVQTPVYSMVNANDDQEVSESVEVFFAGPTFRPIDGSSRERSYNECGYDNGLYEMANNNRKSDTYTKPVKKRIAVTDM